jgi:hypothetical protein
MKPTLTLYLSIETAVVHLLTMNLDDVTTGSAMTFTTPNVISDYKCILVGLLYRRLLSADQHDYINKSPAAEKLVSRLLVREHQKFRISKT